MKFVMLVSALAALEVLVFGFLVGRGRAKYDVPAPATAGHPTWERLNRVHLNSVEQLIVFLPLLWVFAASASQLGAAVLGAVFVVARIVYAVGYVRTPESRFWGSLVTALVQGLLGLGAVVGLVVQIVRA